MQRALRLQQLKNVSNQDIITALNILRHEPNDEFLKGLLVGVSDYHKTIIALVKTLLERPETQLRPFMYECLMDAMADPQGSAKAIRKLIDDMAGQGVEPTSSICRSALQLLAVHPDYILRQEVIDLMRKYWFEIDTEMEETMILAMLREEQYEMAFSKFIALRDANVRTNLWLYDIFIVVFGSEGFLDELFQILQHRKHAKGSDTVFRGLLAYCLDVFSQRSHRDGTVFLWDSAVRSSLLNPSTAVLENVLATAARHGETQIATEALDMLSGRSRVLKHQYETLVDTFARSGDVAGALNILSIMDRNGLLLDRGSSRAIFQAMKDKPSLIDTARLALMEMHKEGSVPFEAVRVTIEATARAHGSEAAMPLYNDIFFLTTRQPDYSLLGDMILHSWDVDTTFKLAKDYMIMVEKDIPDEDPRVYDRVIQACAESKELDFAFQYAKRSMESEEARQPGERSWRQRPWVQPLIEHGLANEDVRVWSIVDEAAKGRDDIANKIKSILERRRRIAKLGNAQKLEPRGDGRVLDKGSKEVQENGTINEKNDDLELLLKGGRRS